VSAEKCNNVRVAGEARLNLRRNLTTRPAVLLLEESTQSGAQIQFAWSLLMVYMLLSIASGSNVGREACAPTFCSSSVTIVTKRDDRV
jgi:hypothetical protein